ncbi:MAG: TonB-dependent receptor [Bacteroidetes bacterium]|nr:MAG: TonB-dependent receptor [Bacteroidota bacterium]
MRVWRMIVVAAWLLTGAVEGAAGQPHPTGTITGRLFDAESQEPLIGANVWLHPTEQGTATDLEGRFRFEHVPVGSYTLRITYLGYAPLIRPDVIVRSDRITIVEAALTPTVLEGDEVVVAAGYFPEDRAVSVTGFDAEEIRRAPGAAGDVSRILSGLPSISPVNDTRNALAVRGGSPMENGFYVDGIPIPNINHFPTQGSSGGAIGLLNVDLIRNVDFAAGGFSAAHGDRLSAVLDIALREGNREETDVQLDLSLGGLGFVGEGGLGDRGAWLVSARRSYLDLVVNVFLRDAADAVPTYSDAQAKLVFDLTDQHRITALGILGLDRSGIDRARAIEQHENAYGDADFTAGTTGLVWRALWPGDGYSTTTLSHNLQAYRIHFFETATGASYFDNRSTEHTLRLRNENTVRFSPAHRLAFGAEIEGNMARYDQTFAASTDPLGQPTPALRLDGRLTTARLGGFVSHTWRPTPLLTLTPGLRLDHHTYTRRTVLAPRLAAALHLTARTTLKAATGLYHQQLPLTLLAQQDASRDLPLLTARHLVAGMEHRLAEHTRVTVEVYDKHYRRFPLDPAQPSLFLVDELFYQVQPISLLLGHGPLVATGQARTRGVEAMLQKKLADRVYGMVSGAYFRSRYRGADGLWRNRVFDSRVLFTIEGGYKPGHRHEVSMKWSYAGGAPFTPFDEAASQAAGRGIFDAARINTARLPAYHALNLRYDRRFHFRRATLITYLSVWNVYDRRNIAGYYWDEVANRRRAVEQFGLLPILGVEFEF